MATGQQFPVVWTSLALIVGLPLLAFCARRLSAVASIFPSSRTFNLTGGIDVKPEFLSLYLALSFYTAAFIAEIVRAGILGVSKGQTRGAGALGLARPGAAARRHAAGDAHHHPAADQPVSEPDQELLAGGRHRLSRSRTRSAARSSTRPARRSRCVAIWMVVYLAISL